MPVVHNSLFHGEAELGLATSADGIASSQRQRKVNHQMANASLG